MSKVLLNYLKNKLLICQSNKYIIFKVLVIISSIVFSLCIDKDHLIKYFKSFLQKNISNKALLDIFDFFRKLSMKSYPGNLENNIQNFEKNHLEEIRRNKGYIEDQYMYSDMKYGLKTIEFSGCEIIAVYNAINDLTGEENKNFPQMIDYFEKDGILLYGLFGTTPLAIEKFFNELEYETMSSTKREDYANIQNHCDTFILTIYNDVEDIMAMIHTVNISKKDGKYFVHNNGENENLIEYDSIIDVVVKINNGKSKDIFLIGIKNK